MEIEQPPNPNSLGLDFLIGSGAESNNDTEISLLVFCSVTYLVSFFTDGKILSCHSVDKAIFLQLDKSNSNGLSACLVLITSSINFSYLNLILSSK
jgi:hypothetical protein